MENFLRVLDSYPVHSISTEQITDHVMRITDGKQVYALKKSRLNRKTITSWQNVFHLAQQHNLAAILPVYMTKQRDLLCQVDGHFYYLTPWIETRELEKKQQIERMYQTIGVIHAKTNQSMSLDVKQITDSFRNYKKTLVTNRSFLLECVEVFEKNHYMSPVELLVCSQYRDLDFILRELEERVELFIDELSNQSEWCYCLCHGKLDFTHYLFADRTYLINWEHANYDNATRDLAALYHNIVNDYDDPTDDYIDFFTAYMKKNSLSKAELYLLSIYLLDPSQYINLLTQHRKNPSEVSQVDMIQRLQRNYRKLSFAVQWMEFTDSLAKSTDETDD